MAIVEVSQIKSADSPSITPFSRWRVANPVGIFDAQFTYNLNPLLYEQITAGTGAAIAHDTTNRMATMTVTTGTTVGGKAFMQSYEYMHYQPGKGQLIFLTFLMGAGVSNVTKFAGYSDGTNGIELQMAGTTVQLQLITGTAHGNETVAQASWNIDPMNGSGPSGLTLDLSKVQILVIDLQALYVGRVRIGFDINGVVYYVHQFLHANLDTAPYIQSANLPVRAGMVTTGTPASGTTMSFICASVISEGGSEDTAARTFGIEGTATAGNNTRVHILSIRPKTTFNSIVNRIKFDPQSLMIGVTGNNGVFWELCIGQAITGTTTFADCNTTYSAFEYNTAGTISGSPAIVIASGYVGPVTGANNSTKGLLSRYPITLDAAGAVRALGTLSVLVTGMGNTSACRVSVNWAEVR